MKNPLRVIMALMSTGMSLCILTDGALADNIPDAVMRVSIVDDRDNIYLALKGRYKLYEVSSGKVLMEGPFLSTRISATGDGLTIGSKVVKTAAVRAKVAGDSNIWVDNRRFRGDIEIVRKDNGRLLVINYIGLDDYLYGVLYHEVSHRWPMEVLKAQAIAARTFALCQAGQNRSQPYDLRNDVYSQMYGGRTSEKWSTTRAVNLTKGKVLKYNGSVLPSYYHATCAGHTEDASNLWNIDAAPLKGVPCGFCKGSPHYRWTKEIALAGIESRMNENGYKIGRILSVSVVSKNNSGRVERLEIKDGAGTSVSISGKDFRQLLGPNNIRSAKFDVSIRGGCLILDGSGWGHGVGMCQWGAYGMARRGKRCEEILRYYYPGAKIATIDRARA